MTSTNAKCIAALAACCLLAAPLPAAACGSGFVLGDEVGAAHPASIGVAFALSDARTGGLLAEVNAPRGDAALQRADETAHKLEHALAAVRPQLPGMSLLLVEARLWTRYAPAGNGQADLHAGHDAGPVDGDVVVVTGEPVLRGLLDGRIGWRQALDAGLVVVTGNAAHRDRVAALLAARFVGQDQAALASQGIAARR